jgi:transcriptional antiterminator RfaH
LEQSERSNKKWYVVYTKPRQEDTAEYTLRTKGVEVFYPKLFLPVPNRRGRQLFPLFPSYLFAHLDASSHEYYRVLWSPGVKRFVSFGATPATVDRKIIDFIRQQANQDNKIVARSNLKVGDEVQISGGPFKGLAGIIQEPPDAKSRIKVLMAILSRQVQVEVPVRYIDVGWVAPCRAWC